jgi:hypothetical protein
MTRTLQFILGLALVAALFIFIVPRAMRAADEWLPISPEDLALKDNPKSPGADAMILYRNSVFDGEYPDSKGESTEDYFRIKIFTAEGKRYANVKVAYYSGNSNEWDSWLSTGGGWVIADVRGRTIHPDGSITKFDGKVYDVMAEKINGVKFRAASFTLPDVQPGSIIEYKYKNQAEPYWSHSEDWMVSAELFTREAHFKFIPSAEYTGFVSHYRVHGIPSEWRPKCDTGFNHACVMDVHDIPAVIKEDLMPPELVVDSTVEWYYMDESAPDTETPEQYWNRLGKKWDGELDRFADKKKAMNEELSRIIAPGDSPEEKLRKIYARVQKIRCLDLQESKLSNPAKMTRLKSKFPGSAEDVLKKEYAGDHEIDSLFVALVRAAGFEAMDFPIAPRNVDFFTPQREDDTQLNADVVWVRAGSKEYYLDPGARYYPFGLLPWYDTQTSGIRTSKNGGTVVQTPALNSTDATLVRNADLTMDPSGNISGTIQVDFTGEEGAVRRTGHHKEDETARKKALEEEIRRWLPADATYELTGIEHWDDAAQPLRVEGSVKLPSLGAIVGHRTLLPADLLPAMYSQAFRPEKRINDVYFDFPYEEIDDLKFHMPAGYKMEALPDAKKIDVGAAKYDLMVNQQTDTVEVKRHLLFNGVAFPRTAYGALRDFFGAVTAYDSTELIFQNAESAKGN